MRRAVLYLRVSTIDQTTANQERELREIAGRMGYERSTRITASVAPRAARSARPSMRSAGMQPNGNSTWSWPGRSIGWAGHCRTLSVLSELHSLRIDLFLHQQGLDTTTPGGKAMFQMMGVFAEFERTMIQERVRAGLARAKSEGKRLGRPPIPAKLEDAIRAALAEPGRPGVRKIAERFGVDPSTVQRISRPFGVSTAAA